MEKVEGFSLAEESEVEASSPAGETTTTPSTTTSSPAETHQPSSTPATSSSTPQPHSQPQSQTQSQPQPQSHAPAPSRPHPPSSSSSSSSQEDLKQRLQKRLEELRAARRADGLNGKPARTRQELIEARRQREEARRAHKKELRQKAKEEEQRKNDEAIARRFSAPASRDGSVAPSEAGGDAAAVASVSAPVSTSASASAAGSLLASPGSPAESITSISNNYSFGRIMFADGQTAADPGLTALRAEGKKRGPQDPKTALLAAQAKRQRLAALDPVKRAEIEEKERWLNAKKRAHGEKVRDDVSLLKKSVQRREGMKKKSEKEWRERIEG
ncbi:hypothetical protein KEM52_002568, partial [Ascosphaera acerosa]